MNANGIDDYPLTDSNEGWEEEVEGVSVPNRLREWVDEHWKISADVVHYEEKEAQGQGARPLVRKFRHSDQHQTQPRLGWTLI